MTNKYHNVKMNFALDKDMNYTNNNKKCNSEIIERNPNYHPNHPSIYLYIYIYRYIFIDKKYTHFLLGYGNELIVQT